jgi:hypothetical protein
VISPLTSFDVLAQMRRRWTIVVGGALVGLLVGISVGTPSPSAALLGSAALVGTAVGFGVAFVLVKLHPRVTTVADIRRVTGLPVVAQLPTTAIDADDLDDRPLSRRMRTTLREGVMNAQILAGGLPPARIVLARTDSVTEAGGVDGGIARALVESGRVTALVHTDFESRINARPSTVMPTPLDEEAPRLDAGGYEREPVPERVTAARAHDRLARVEELLVSLGERYDVTVAQAASNSQPLALRDIAPTADVVLLVARSNRTTVESLLAVYGELLSVGVSPLGVIMTGVAARHRVLLRNTWAPGDFRSSGGASRTTAVASAPVVGVPATLSVPPAGFSIADLVSRSSGGLPPSSAAIDPTGSES